MFMSFHIVHVLFIVKGNYIIFANDSANKGSFECLNYVCNVVIYLEFHCL